MTYKVVKGTTALGTEHSFVGPGLSSYASSVHFLQVPCEWALQCFAKDAEENHGDHSDREAETIVRLLREAFEAGRKDAKREIRAILDIRDHR